MKLIWINLLVVFPNLSLLSGFSCRIKKKNILLFYYLAIEN